MNFRNIQRKLDEHPTHELRVGKDVEGPAMYYAKIVDPSKPLRGPCEYAGTPEAALFMLNVRLIEHTPVLVQVFDDGLVEQK